MKTDLIDIRRALENGEIVPWFQPLVELHTGRLAGFEVLVRWQHPQLGAILPSNFISIAEENGLIGLLTQQVLRQAFQSAKLLPEPLVLAVNISPCQLQNLGLPDEIRKAADLAGFPLKRLTIEITESALFNNLERAQTTTRRLKAMGCRLAMDDFGTGYSSLAHLQALPFDVLKIDRSFISSMTNTRESRKIVAAIIGLGHSLGLITLAEGIETEQQAEMLLLLGCEMGQGWLYGKPVPADQIPNLIGAPPRAISEELSAPGGEWGISSLEALPSQRLAQLQAIYDGAPVGLCFLDRNLRYVSINQRLADMNGKPAAAYVGRTIEEMVPESFAALKPLLHGALQGEAFSEVEGSRPPKKPGEAPWTALVWYQPAMDEANEVIGISIAVVDITEHKRTVEELARLAVFDAMPVGTVIASSDLQPEEQPHY
jgi:PAS domain S-box-containing protein